MNPYKLRKHVLDMVYQKASGHIGGSFSLAEIICFLYDSFNLVHKYNEEGDILILSKGHAAPIIYAAQIESGVYPETAKETFREINSPFQGHPDIRFNPYIHASTGSLGQGLSIACGVALDKKRKGSSDLVFCIVGDGELNEGQNYEALMFAAKYNLDNLIVILDSNGYQNDGSTDDIMPIHNLKQIVEGFGWRWANLNGHSLDLIASCRMFFSFEGKPKFLNLNTIKGYGVEFMQGQGWHSKVPSEKEYRYALELLEKRINEKSN